MIQEREIQRVLKGYITIIAEVLITKILHINVHFIIISQVYCKDYSRNAMKNMFTWLWKCCQSVINVRCRKMGKDNLGLGVRQNNGMHHINLGSEQQARYDVRNSTLSLSNVTQRLIKHIAQSISRSPTKIWIPFSREHFQDSTFKEMLFIQVCRRIFYDQKRN